LIKEKCARREIRKRAEGNNDTNILIPLINGKPVPRSYGKNETRGSQKCDPPGRNNETPGGLNSETQNIDQENQIPEKQIDLKKENTRQNQDFDVASAGSENDDLESQRMHIEQDWEPYKQHCDKLLDKYEPEFRKWYWDVYGHFDLKEHLDACINHLKSLGNSRNVKDLPAYFRGWLQKHIINARKEWGGKRRSDTMLSRKCDNCNGREGDWCQYAGTSGEHLANLQCCPYDEDDTDD
jgi:hypothetical protein